MKELDFEYVAKVKKQWLGVKQRVAGCTKYMNWTSDD